MRMRRNDVRALLVLGTLLVPETGRAQQPWAEPAVTEALDTPEPPVAGVGAEAVDPTAGIELGDGVALRGGTESFAPAAATPTVLPSGTSPSAVSPQALSLPSGEGSLEGMGESFSPSLSSGTLTYTVPLEVPPGRAGVEPSLSLAYSSAGGSSVAGWGWSFGAPAISRQTDRGLPRYVDGSAWHPQEDRFVYAGGHELVPVGSDAAAAVDGGAVPAELEGWQQYRSRVEGSFLRFFRSPDGQRWVVQGKDGTRLDFGELPEGEGPADAVAASSAALVQGPDGRVFSWGLTRTSDSHGSTIYYQYATDEGQRYLEDVYYVSPASCAAASVEGRRRCAAPLADYAVRVHVVYETRPDPYTSYVSGWRIRTAWRVKRVEMSAAGDTVGTRYLVRRYHLGYDPGAHASLLASVQLEGRPDAVDPSVQVRVGDPTVPESTLGDAVVGATLPPMRFRYSGSRGTDGLEVFDGRAIASPASPDHSVDEARADLFDVNSDGLPDLIVTDPARYATPDGSPAVGVYFNGFEGSGAEPGRAGAFSDPVPMPMDPTMGSVMSLSNRNVAAMDVDGDGRSDLLHMPRAAEYGYFTPSRLPDEASGVSPASQGWAWAYVPVALPAGDTDPRIDLARDGEHIRVLDVNNDHLIDVVRTNGTTVQTWLDLGWLPGGDGRFGSATFDGTAWVLSTEPLESCLMQSGMPVDFDDPEVRLADMNGDGLQDVARIRRGRVIWWPGRGDGLFGTHEVACDGTIARDNHVEMADPPVALEHDLESVHLADANGDGAADVVQVRSGAIDVWINLGGEGFSARTIVRGTPPLAFGSGSRVRLVDVDGSGTLDVLYGNARGYQWVDLLGGLRPRLLTEVDNGLGALTTFEYGSSADDYLQDLADAAACTGTGCETFDWSHVTGSCEQRFTGECVYRSGGSPVVSTVLRSATTTDRTDALGIAANVIRTRYAYHDGYYEGVEQEFRGFGATDVYDIGDSSHPTARTRTRMHQGRRPNSIATDRLAQNPNEALKGLTYLEEVADDDSGAYISTTHTTFAVRQLMTGLDGRRVDFAYPIRTDSVTYDDAPFAAAAPGTLLPLTTGGTDFPGVLRQVVGPGGGVTDDTSWPEVSHAIPLRSEHYAHVVSTTDDVDNAGNVLQKTDWGRVRGEWGEPLPDETIVSHTVPTLLDPGRWLWRTQRSWTTGHGSSEPLGLLDRFFDPDTGDVQVAVQQVALPRAFRFDGDGRGAASLVQRGDDLVDSARFDAWGSIVATCKGADVYSGPEEACLRHSTATLDASYGQLTVSEATATRRSAGGWVELVTSARWDRGLGAPLRVVDPNGEVTEGGFDGLGRQTYTRSPSVRGCEGSSVPHTRTRYVVTSDPASTPLSYAETSLEQSCASIGDDALVVRTYTDGLGRTRAQLQAAEAPHAWERSQTATFDARGQTRKSWQPDMIDVASPSLSEVVAPASVPYTLQSFDAVGRPRCMRREDGALSCTSYHALSTEQCDPLDHDPASPFYRTCTTTRTDGHGRVVDTVLRNVEPGTSEVQYYRLWASYRADGQVVLLERAQTAGSGARAWSTVVDDRIVRRTFTYDSIGRRIASSDADTDARRTGLSDGERTWRYLFNRAGDLAAVRDPRGCGQNFYYDLAGRLVGEDYVGCQEAALVADDSGLSVPAGSVALDPIDAAHGVDVRNYFDTYPAWATGEAAPPSDAGGTAGRATATADAAQRTVMAYDARGDVVWAARQIAQIASSAAPPSTLGDPLPRVEPGDVVSTGPRLWDEAHTYVKTARYDHGGRQTSLVLPPDPDWSGSGPAPLVGGAIEYNRRGLPLSTSYTVDGVRRPIVSDVLYTRDGLPTLTTWGDDGDGARPPTTTRVEYDIRRRPARMATERTPSGTSSTVRSLREVTVLSDLRLDWDAVDNLVRVRDARIAEEWPDGQRPRAASIGHDALYRVSRVDYTYENDSGPTVEDPYSPWREELALLESADPMGTNAAPMVTSMPEDRAVSLTWDHDWLGNVTDWTDDAHLFHERSLGRGTYGVLDGSGRPSALRLSTNLPDTAPASADGTADRGGWVELDYGDGGNVATVTVHAQCADDVSSAEVCWSDPADDLETRREDLRRRCSCASEQHYEYRWDEVNRLADARRYDRRGVGSWELAAHMQYRYDATNRRVVKQVGDAADRRFALYVFEDDFERRGLVQDVDGSYVASATLGGETQYLVGGARIVWAHGDPTAALDPRHRATMAISDAIGSTSAVIDLRSGDVVEASTFYPNGARETFRTSDVASVPSEPSGFTGKEADAEVGLTCFGERYLMPHLGRWASPDPLQIHAAGGGEAMNNYHYVSGSILQSRDPIGLDDQDIPLGVDFVETGRERLVSMGFGKKGVDKLDDLTLFNEGMKVFGDPAGTWHLRRQNLSALRTILTRRMHGKRGWAALKELHQFNGELKLSRWRVWPSGRAWTLVEVVSGQELGRIDRLLLQDWSGWGMKTRNPAYFHTDEEFEAAKDAAKKEYYRIAGASIRRKLARGDGLVFQSFFGAVGYGIADLAGADYEQAIAAGRIGGTLEKLAGKAMNMRSARREGLQVRETWTPAGGGPTEVRTPEGWTREAEKGDIFYGLLLNTWNNLSSGGGK